MGRSSLCNLTRYYGRLQAKSVRGRAGAGQLVELGASCSYGNFVYWKPILAYRGAAGGAKPTIRHWPSIPFQGHYVNNSPSSIPAIENERQRRALSLFCEALASNNDYLAFLFFWHVLDVRGDRASEIVDQIVADSSRLRLSRYEIEMIATGGETIGAYLYRNARTAIAHIVRTTPGWELQFNSLEERQQFSNAVRAVRAIAHDFISHELRVGAKHLLLMRKGAKGFPTYVDTGKLPERSKWREAYPRKPIRIGLK